MIGIRVKENWVTVVIRVRDSWRLEFGLGFQLELGIGKLGLGFELVL